MTDHAWGYWHRPAGGWFLWDVHGTGAVIGHVRATEVIDDGWVAFPEWTAGLDPIVGPFHSRNAAAEALFAAWLADPDTNAPEVPAP
jgi:hypothetical protein